MNRGLRFFCSIGSDPVITVKIDLKSTYCFTAHMHEISKYFLSTENQEQCLYFPDSTSIGRRRFTEAARPTERRGVPRTGRRCMMADLRVDQRGAIGRLSSIDLILDCMGSIRSIHLYGKQYRRSFLPLNMKA